MASENSWITEAKTSHERAVVSERIVGPSPSGSPCSPGQTTEAGRCHLPASAQRADRTRAISRIQHRSVDTTAIGRDLCRPSPASSLSRRVRQDVRQCPAHGKGPGNASPRVNGARGRRGRPPPAARRNSPSASTSCSSRGARPLPAAYCGEARPAGSPRRGGSSVGCRARHEEVAPHDGEVVPLVSVFRQRHVGLVKYPRAPSTVPARTPAV